MFVVNAANNDNPDAEEFYRRTITVDANTEYRVSFWLYNIWLGKSSLAVTFWLYYVVIFSVGSNLMETYLPIEENKWIFFVVAAAAIYISVAVWRSATNYKLIKLKKKQTNIWGIAAKIIVILQFLMLGARAVYFLSII